MREKRFKTRSVEETLALGERIAAMLHPPLHRDSARRGRRGQDHAGKRNRRGPRRGHRG